MLLLITTMVTRAGAACLGGKVLYNGICWRGPTRRTAPPVDPELPPYVLEPPALINISLGRQLFVDTFLINDSATTPPRSWRITYHQASYGDDEEPFPPKGWEPELDEGVKLLIQLSSMRSLCAPGIGSECTDGWSDRRHMADIVSVLVLCLFNICCG